MSAVEETVSAVEETTDSLPFSKEEIQVIHEATLQDLLRFRNFAAMALLAERNELLRERVSLGGTPFDYSEVEFLSEYAPAKMQPYKIMGHGFIRQYWAKRPSWARYPPDTSETDGFSPETSVLERHSDEDPIDADTTLTEITPSVQTGEPKEEAKN
ncbi:hypothetical protein EDB84DRAFT_1443869 [Lactarius hengduanensis]|nr:hypothetical protein EDB84DRAFT_1443869 [Lactarius hengduanensis]